MENKQLLSGCGFVQRITPPSLLRERKIKMPFIKNPQPLTSKPGVVFEPPHSQISGYFGKNSAGFSSDSFSRGVGVLRITFFTPQAAPPSRLIPIMGDVQGVRPHWGVLQGRLHVFSVIHPHVYDVTNDQQANNIPLKHLSEVNWNKFIKNVSVNRLVQANI